MRPKDIHEGDSKFDRLKTTLMSLMANPSISHPHLEPFRLKLLQMQAEWVPTGSFSDRCYFSSTRSKIKNSSNKPRVASWCSRRIRKLHSL